MFEPIQNFIDDYKELKIFLIEHKQISLENNTENYLRKVMLLSCASYFETKIQNIIKEFVFNNASDDRISHFLNNKAIARQYHTYFDWDKSNINKFLGLFGPDFRKKISSEISENDELKLQIKAFLELGNERNLMVHENFMEYDLNKTFDEIIVLYEKAEKFIDFLQKCFE